ncbi:serine/threonine-protein kinase [Polyangium jinanense]|uniref:Serine/threonine protein kinase n=1 Tax=Polyangium jinanense TaxID=2829994 RepID=A0A9X3XC13_9BACT|nr:serine/threonine-protein kinase [Polyangium jinanense]MDC3959196.1 serine/threonine protein kinase [Polyangium jinanense]MDC3987584.1 serine/threonine protein kinase [Polyangium jinanense]
MTSHASPIGSSATAVAPGTLLAQKYRVERVLGQGGMGYVVEARHVALDERVALKFLLPEYAQHPEASARFQREARAAVKIKSEHVARVLDVATLENGAPYMVMEFLDGRDLARQLKDGVLSVPDAIDYVLQACEAIAEAHAHGIVHRDLKPANLFLASRPDGSPLVKLLDFGISKMKNAPGDHALTRTATAMGSALYMSPEQMQETRGVDHRTDIYSLGITLFELLAGTQPFYAETLPNLCAEVLTGTPRPLRQFRPELPADLAARIERAYERDKNRRYPSIGEFAVALAPYAPPRSQSTLERITRMAGLPTPELPSRQPSQPTLPAFAPADARASTEWAEGPSTVPLGNTGRRNAAVSSTLSSAPSPAEVATQTAHKTMPLPVQIASSPELPSSATTTTGPSIITLGQTPSLDVIEPDLSRIEADLYTGPRSAHAAAAFASAARTRTPSDGGRSFLFVALGLGALIGVLGGVLVFLFRSSVEASSTTPIATGAPQEVPAPPAPTSAATPTSTAPTVTPESTAPPIPSASASPAMAASAVATAPAAPSPGPKPTSKATVAPTSTTKKDAKNAFNRR